MKKLFLPLFLLGGLVFNTVTAEANMEIVTNKGVLEPQFFPDKKEVISPKSPLKTVKAVAGIQVNKDAPQKSVIIDDEREEVADINKSPYNTVAKVTCTYAGTGNEYEGTGVVIGNSSILTAAHVIYNLDEGKFAESCVVVVGATSTAPSGKAKVTGTKFFIPKKWINTEIQYDKDFGVIKLDSNLGNITGTSGLTNMLYENEKIETVGYPQFLKENVMYHASGNIKATTDKVFYHDLDSWTGQSGSPIWNSSGLLVGLHTAGVFKEPKPNPLDNQYNKGIRFTNENYDYILYWLNAYNGRVYGTTNEELVSISREDEKIWGNLEFSLANASTTGLLGKVYYAKIYYNLPNGFTYLSLYDKDNKFQGYINTKNIVDVDPVPYGKNVTITKSGYDIWGSLFFSEKKALSDTYLNKQLFAKETYTLANGRVYYSIYNSSNKFLGYINASATK